MSVNDSSRGRAGDLIKFDFGCERGKLIEVGRVVARLLLNQVAVKDCEIVCISPVSSKVGQCC